MFGQQTLGSARVNPESFRAPRAVSGVLAGHTSFPFPSFPPLLCCPATVSPSVLSVLFRPILAPSRLRRGRRPGLARRSEMKAAGRPQGPFKIKNPSQNVRKIVTVSHGKSRGLTPLPPRHPIPCAHSNAPFPQNPLFSTILPLFHCPIFVSFLPLKTRDL